MDIQKLLKAALAGLVGMFILSGLWHAVIMKDVYQSTGDANMPIIMLAYVILALLMSYAYPIGFKGGSPVKEGLRFGVLIGLIWILPLQLIFYGMGQSELGLVLVDVPWHLVEQGIGGIIIGYIYGS